MFAAAPTLVNPGTNPGWSSAVAPWATLPQNNYLGTLITPDQLTTPAERLAQSQGSPVTGTTPVVPQWDQYQNQVNPLASGAPVIPGYNPSAMQQGYQSAVHNVAIPPTVNVTPGATPTITTTTTDGSSPVTTYNY